jgi:hypothetical protein
LRIIVDAGKFLQKCKSPLSGLNFKKLHDGPAGICIMELFG